MPLIAVIDTETTGVNPHKCEILTIGCVLLDERTLDVLGEYESPIMRVSEGVDLNEEALGINGIKVEDIRNGADRKETFLAFIDWILACAKGHKVIWSGHNTPFDRGFFQTNVPKVLPEVKLDDIFDYHGDYDTSVLARAKLKRKGLIDSVSLIKVAAYLGYEGHKAHNALEDCRATAFVLRKLIEA